MEKTTKQTKVAELKQFPDAKAAALKALAEADTKDIEACRAEITASLAKYGCDIGVAMMITGTGNYPQVQVIKKK